VSRLPTLEPVRTLETEPFWASADEGRLVLPRCDACEAVIWYPRRWCPMCHQHGVSWFEATGHGTVYSFTVVRQAGGDWQEAVPYVIAFVELDEGPRVLTNVVDVDPDTVRVGDEVSVVFDRHPAGAAVPRFAPVGR
jgi:uncharacterized OB-fold protein